MCGLTVAQISEFSLILIALGYSLGHISQQMVSLVTLVGIITIAGSTYLILYADPIYRKIKWILDIISIRKHHHRESATHTNQPEVIIFGYDRVGHDFVSSVGTMSEKYLVVDYNPQSIKRLKEKGIPHRFGDADDVEFLQEIGFQDAQLIISSIPDHKTNLLLIRYYRKGQTKDKQEGIIILTAHHLRDAKELYEAGATYVVMPHYLGAHHVALLVERHKFSKDGFAHERSLHLANIAKREKN
jgi:voltage-gated potassium channel Kch